MRPFDDLGTTRWIDKERWSAVWPFSSIAQHDCDLRVTLWNGVKRFRRLERRESLPLEICWPNIPGDATAPAGSIPRFEQRHQAV